MRKLILAVCLALGVCLPGLASEARADYPQDRPLNIIVPFGPGGAVDIAGRILAEYFQKEFKITINVINKPGGAQAIGLNDMPMWVLRKKTSSPWPRSRSWSWLFPSTRPRG